MIDAVETIAIDNSTIHQVSGIDGTTLIVFVTTEHCWQFRLVSAGGAAKGVELPIGATHLASSQKYQNQAFAWGKSALALQFHPEVTALGLERWFIGHAGETSTTSGLNVEALRAGTARYAPQLQIQASQFWRTWLGKFAC